MNGFVSLKICTYIIVYLADHYYHENLCLLLLEIKLYKIYFGSTCSFYIFDWYNHFSLVCTLRENPVTTTQPNLHRSRTHLYRFYTHLSIHYGSINGMAHWFFGKKLIQHTFIEIYHVPGPN